MLEILEWIIVQIAKNHFRQEVLLKNQHFKLEKKKKAKEVVEEGKEKIKKYWRSNKK